MASCARSSAAGEGDSGIAGRVVVGPSCPVEVANSPCPDRPLATDLEIVRGSEVVASVRSGDDGRFRVALDPGSYTIRPKASDGPFPTGQAVNVTVPPHTFVSVTVPLDSGIR
jgi:hypothetical protein